VRESVCVCVCVLDGDDHAPSYYYLTTIIYEFSSLAKVSRTAPSWYTWAHIGLIPCGRVG